MTERERKKSKWWSIILIFSLLLFSFPLVSAQIDGDSFTNNHLPIPFLLIILGLGVILFLGSLAFDDSGFLMLASCVLFFIAGFTINAGLVGFNSGEKAFVYGNNFTYANGSANYHWDYDGSTIPDKSDTNIILFHEEPVYLHWDDSNSHLVGWLLMVISAITFALTLFYLGTRED